MVGTGSWKDTPAMVVAVLLDFLSQLPHTSLSAPETAKDSAVSPLPVCDPNQVVARDSLWQEGRVFLLRAQCSSLQEQTRHSCSIPRNGIQSLPYLSTSSPEETCSGSRSRAAVRPQRPGSLSQHCLPTYPKECSAEGCHCTNRTDKNHKPRLEASEKPRLDKIQLEIIF